MKISRISRRTFPLRTANTTPPSPRSRVEVIRTFVAVTLAVALVDYAGFEPVQSGVWTGFAGHHRIGANYLDFGEVVAASGLEVVRGTLSNRNVAREAMAGVTHVLHLATCKETPLDIMDVAIKGMFWLLEACRTSPTFQQFILIGGDAGMGHFFYPHPIPITETQKHSAYPGCYALSKVLEEVMLEQYYIQYDFKGCCLRAPWIMEKDDFKYTLSFGEDVFGGPRWRDLFSPPGDYRNLLTPSTAPIPRIPRFFT